MDYSIFYPHPPPLIEGPGFLRGRGLVNFVSTFDLLIKPEGGVFRHFDLRFLGSQKFTSLGGGVRILDGVAQ